MGGRKDDGKAVRTADSRIGWQKKNGGASGGTPSVRKNGCPVGGGALRLIRLVTCGGIFVLLVAAKLLLPGRMAGVSQKLSEAMTRSVDVQAVFSAVGGPVYQGRHPGGGGGRGVPGRVPSGGRGDPADHRPDSGRRGTDGAAELAGRRAVEHDPACGRGPGSEELETMDLVLYSDEDLPENVSMRQAILGFDHETPVKGVLSSNFGYRDHPLEGTERFHYGVDLAADTGTAIACFADGTVTAVGESSSYGKYCTVTHANGCTTLYAHCGRISVSSGAAVKKGEKLGEVGETGMATGPHLHFELQKDGVYLNPIYYVETA